MATHDDSIALGTNALAAFGNKSASAGGRHGNVAIGANTLAEGAGTVAIGGMVNEPKGGAYANNEGSIAIGSKAEAVGAILTLGGSYGTTTSKGTDSEYARQLGNFTYDNKGNLVLDKNGNPVIEVANFGINLKQSQMIAIGDSAAAYGDQSTALGANSIAAGVSSIAIGGDDLGRGNAKAHFKNVQNLLGDGEDLNKDGEIKGNERGLSKELTDNGYDIPETLLHTKDTTHPNYGGKAFADTTLAKGDASIAFGQKAIAGGHLSNAVGALSRTVGNNSNAIGTASVAGADNSIAMGAVATTGEDAERSTAIGYMAQTGGEIALGDIVSLQIDPADKTKGTKKFSVNGEEEQELSELGSVKIDDKGVEHKGVHTGTGVNSVAVGEHNKVLGNNSTAVGQGNIIIGNNSGAFGDPNVIIGNDSKALGNDNVVAANKAFVVGNNVNKTADNSVFLGDSAAYVKAEDNLTRLGNSTAGVQQYKTNAKEIRALNEDGLEQEVVIKKDSLNFAGAYAYVDKTDPDNPVTYAVNKIKAEDENGNWVDEYFYIDKNGDYQKVKENQVSSSVVGVVSVGDKGQERRIQNVAAGLIDAQSTDAINGSQLYSVIQNLPRTPLTPINAENGLANLANGETGWVDVDGKPLTVTDIDGNPYTGKLVNVPGSFSYVDETGRPVTVKNADGSQYVAGDGEDPRLENNSNKFVTAGDVVNTINNVYWSVDGQGNGNNDEVAHNVKAGNKVDLIGGDGVSIDQVRVNLDSEGNEVIKVTEDDGTEKWYQVKLDDNGNKVADTDKEEVKAADVKDTTQFTFKAETPSTQINAQDGLASLPDPYDYNDKDGKPVTITNADGSPYTGGNVVKKADGIFTDDKGNPLTMTGADGKPYTEVPNIVDNSNKFVTAGDVRDTINNVYWSVDAKGDGNNAAAPYNINAGRLVDLVGDGISIDQETLLTDGKGNEVIKVTEDDGTEKWYKVKLENGKKVADKTQPAVAAADVKDTAKFTFKAESAQQPVVYTDADGNKLTKNDAGDWVNPKKQKVGEDGKPVFDADGNPIYETVKPADVIASMNNGDNSTTTPMTLDNIASNLTPSTSDGILIGKDGSTTFNDTPVVQNDAGEWVEADEDGKPTNKKVAFTDEDGKPTDALKNALTKSQNAPDNAIAMTNNAATVGDVLNAGWNLQGNDTAVDFVKPYDTVNFINGAGTTAKVTSDGLTSKVSFDVGVDNKTTQITYVDKDSDPVVKNGDDWYKADDIGEDGKPKDGTSPVNAKNVSSQVVAKTTPLTMEQDSSKKPTGKVVTPTDTGLATAADVANAINKSGWKVKGSGNPADGNNFTTELINPGEEVELIAGEGLKLKQNGNKFEFLADIDQDGNSKTKLTSEQTKVPTAGDGNYGNYTDGNIQLALKHDKDSDTDTFDVKLNNNVKLGDDKEAGSLNVSDKKDGDKPVANTEIKPNEINFTDAGDNNTGKITGLGSHLADGTGNKMPDASAPTNFTNNKNEAATLGDVLNAGWNLQAEGKAVDFVTHGDTVNFASSDKSVSISGSTGSTVDFKVNKAENYTANDDGTISAPTPAPITNADGTTTTPTQFWDATQTADAINNAAWQITSSTAGDDVQKVKAGDKVDLKAGKGITIAQSGTDFTFSTNLKGENGIEVVDNADGSQTIKYTGKGDGNRKTTVTNTDGNLVVTPNLKDDNNHIYDVALNNTITVGDDTKGEKPITIDGTTGDITLGGDNGGNINNVANHINPDGSMIDPAAPTNQAATVQDVLNSGWNVKVGNADPEYIKHGEQVAFIDGKGTKVSGSKDGIAYDINVDQNSPLSINKDGALTVNVGGFDNTTDGSVKANNPNGLATAGDIANAVNNSGWNVTTSASTGEVSGTTKELIKPTNTVTFDAGDNIAIVQSGNQISVGTTRNINVAGNLNVAGNTNVHNLNVAPNSNVDMGGNQIHNVAPGTADTDAVNVSQLKQAVGGDLTNVHNRIDGAYDHANASAASAIAVASMPQAYLPGKSLIAIGGGSYRGQTGYAIGISSISDGGNWIIKGTATGNSKGNYGVGLGAGYQW